jgi:hypothetical protein
MILNIIKIYARLPHGNELIYCGLVIVMILAFIFMVKKS